MNPDKQSSPVLPVDIAKGAQFIVSNLGFILGARCAPKLFTAIFQDLVNMSFREHLEQEPTSSIPLRDAVEVHSGTVVRGAIAEMRTRSLGCAVIVDYGLVPSGIFTEQSVIELLVQNASLDDRPIQDFADSSFITVKSSEPISRVWDAIQLDGARFVCVTDDDGKLIGITGQRGVAEYLADCFAKQVTVQRLGSTPWMQDREGA